MKRISILQGVAICGIAALLVSILPLDAWARAGSARSSGSRGSRSYSSPSRSYSAPTPSQSGAQPFTQPSAPLPQPAPASSGGFWRSMAGGVAGGLVGGLLGGMLFRGLGFAGGAGGFGGGFGMMDLLLLAGIAYLIYWIVRRRRVALATDSTTDSTPYFRGTVAPYPMAGTAYTPPGAGLNDLEAGLSHIRQMDPDFNEATFRDSCTDRFFQIQAAWMHREVEKLRPLLTEEMLDTFRKDIEAARTNRHLNKLENIAVRSVELTEAWQEQGKDYVTVRFVANLMDFTVDETTGAVVAGSDTAPVKFEEYWTWVRPVGPNAWRLTAINQAE